MKQEFQALKAKFRALSSGAKVALCTMLALACIGGPAATYYFCSVASQMGGLIEDTNKIHTQQHGGIKFGANVDHSTTSIHGGHTLVVEGDTLGGFMSGADKTKLDGVATNADVTTESSVRAATASFSADPSFNSHKITSLADGTASSDSAAFHQIGDAILAGRQTTLDAISPSTNQATLSGLAQTIDGVALSVAGMRVGLFGQTTTTQDGCYVTASGAWTRCTDLPTGAAANHRHFVTVAGSSNKGVWSITNASGSDVVGTNDLAVANQATGGGGGQTFPPSGDLAMGGFGFTGARDPSSAQDFATKNYVDGITAYVNAATTASLPAYTTSGGPGVGFTLTASANGAFPTLDGFVSLNVGDSFLFQHGSSASDNGVYKVVSLGGVSSTWSVIRDTRFDTAAEISGSRIRVRFGQQRGGGEYVYKAQATITMGTTALYWPRADSNMAQNEGFRCFDDLTATITTITGGNQAVIPGPCSYLAAAVQTASTVASLSTNGTAGVIGELGLTIGSVASAFAEVTSINTSGATGGGSFVFDNTVDVEGDFRWSGSALSTGAQEYALNIGFIEETAGSQVTPAHAIMFQYDRPTSVNIQAVTNDGGGTPTKVDTGVVYNANQRYRGHITVDAGSGMARFYLDGASVANISTHLPSSVTLAQNSGVFRSVGTTTVTNALIVDWMGQNIRYPKGRAN